LRNDASNEATERLADLVGEKHGRIKRILSYKASQAQQIMTDLVRRGKVRRMGSTLYLTLTKEFLEVGAEQGSAVLIKVQGKSITITKEGSEE